MPARTEPGSYSAPGTPSRRRRKPVPSSLTSTVGSVAAATGAATAVGARGGTRAQATQAAQTAYAGTQVAGPSVTESSSYRRARRQQARVISKYAYDNETNKLADKHYDFDAQGRVSKKKATDAEIHADLKEARGNVKRTTTALFGNPRIYQANVKGRVLGPKKIERINERRVSTTMDRRGAIHKRKQQLLSTGAYKGPTAPAQAKEQAKLDVKASTPGTALHKAVHHKGSGGGPISGSTQANPLGPLPQGIRTAGYAATLAALPVPVAKARLFGTVGKALTTRGVEAAAKRLAPAQAAHVAELAAKAPKPVGAGIRFAEEHPFLSAAPVYGTLDPEQGVEALRRIGIGTAGQAKGFIENPDKVIERTGQAAYGMLTAAVGDLANVAITGGRAAMNVASQLPGGIERVDGGEPAMPYSWEEVVAPTTASFDAFIEANKHLGDTILSGDLEKATEATKSEFGLAPAIQAALLLKPLGGGRAFEAGLRGTRRGAERARGYLSDLPEGSRLGEFAARKNLGRRRPETDVPQHVFSIFERKAQRVEESERAAVTTEQQRGELAAVTNKITRAGRRRDFKKGYEDYIGPVVQYGLDLSDTAAARSTLHDLKASVPKDSRNWADFDALDKALPTLAKSKGFREATDAYREWDQFWREEYRAGKVDERSVYQPIAALDDLRYPEERTPPQVADIVRAEPKAGQNMRPVIRDEAKVDRKGVRNLRGKARKKDAEARAAKRELRVREVAGSRRTAVRATNKKVRTLTRRRDAWAEKAAKAKNPETRRRYQAKVDQLEKQIRETRATLTIGASPVRLRNIKRIVDARRAAKDLRAQAEQLAEHARRKEEAIGVERRQSSEAVLDDYVAEAQDALAARGLKEPAWLSHRPASGKDVGELSVQQTYRGGFIPAKEKMRHGKLLASGNVDYSYASLVAESIFNRVNPHFIRQHVADVLGQERIQVKIGDQEKTLLTGPEARRAEQEGQISAKHNTLVALQEVNRVLDEGTTDDLAAAFGESLWGEVRRAEGTEGKKYVVIPKETTTEMMAQLKGVKGKALRNLQRASSRLLLGTSPAWAISQVFAEGFQATAAVNAYRMTRGYDAWKRLPESTRRKFAAQMEAAEGGGIIPETMLSLRHSAADDMSEAMKAYDRTYAGKALHELGTLNPLIAADRWKSNQLRIGVAAGEVDRALNSYLTGLGSLRKVQGKVISQLKGKPLEEQLTYIAEHPEVAKEIAAYTRDVMGSWSALTRYERTFGPISMFYPYLRMSLRWTFRSFPARHPIKAAILWNLATANAIEVRHLLGGDPSFAQTFGQVPLYTGPEGEATQMLPLGRIAPAGNVLIEAGIDPESTDLGAFARAINPIISSALLIGLNTDPVTGKRLTDKQLKEVDTFTEKAARWGAQLLSLPSAARALDVAIHHDSRSRDAVPIIGPRNPSPYAQLFRNIMGPGQVIRSYGIPFLPVDLERQQISERVARLLQIGVAQPSRTEITDAPKSEHKRLVKKYEAGKKAWKTLDKYLVAWGVETEAQQKRQDKNYEERSSHVNDLIEEYEGTKTKKPETGYGAIDLGGGKTGYGDIDVGGGKKGGYGDVILNTPGGGRKQVKAISMKDAITRAAYMTGSAAGLAARNRKAKPTYPTAVLGGAETAAVPRRLDQLYRQSGLPGTPPKYKLGQKMPKMPGSDQRAWAYYDPKEDTVAFSRRATKSLEQGRPGAVLHTLHEFAHSAQRTDLTRAEREGGADVFARQTAEGMGIDTKGRLAPAYAPFRQAARREGPGFVKDQFEDQGPPGKGRDDTLARNNDPGRGKRPASEGKKVIGKVPAAVPDQYRKWVAKYGKLVTPAARGTGLTGPEYLAATIDFETGGTWDPSIQNPDSGAFGLGQFMAGTAQTFQSEYGVDPLNPNDPESQIKASAMHLSGDYGHPPLYAGYNPGYSDTDPILGRAAEMGVSTKVKGGKGGTGGGDPYLTVKKPGKIEVYDGANREGVPLTQEALDFARSASAKLPGKSKPVITTGSNHSQMTASGYVSDHWDGNGMDYGLAVNSGGDMAWGDDFATAAIEATGVPHDEARAMAVGGGIHDLPVEGGGSVQIIWRAADHYDHVHIGVQPDEASTAPTTTGGGVSGYSGGSSPGAVTTTSTSAYTGSAAPSSGGFTPPVPGMKPAKEPKPKFSQAKLLKAIGEDQGFNALFGGEPAPPADEDATMAAMAEIAATRKRLLKR